MAVQEFTDYWPTLPAGSLTPAPLDLTSLDGQYVLKSGDTMTGPLDVEADFTVVNGTTEGKIITLSDGRVYLQHTNDNGATYRNAILISDLGFIEMPANNTAGDLEVRMTNATSVKVPDATADGQALAYGQSNPLFGNEITTTGSYPKLDIWSSVQGYMRFGGLDEITRFQQVYNIGSEQYKWSQYDAAGSLVRSPLVLADTGSLSMSAATSVIVPAVADGATQAAAQVTARDSVTGGYNLAEVRVGHTGIRDVTADLTWPGDATTTAAYLVRSKDTVTLKIAMDGPALAGAHTLLSTLWAGFSTSYDNVVRYGVASWVDPDSYLYHLGTSSLAVVKPNAGYKRFELSWHATSGWPPTLPGTQITPPQ